MRYDCAEACVDSAWTSLPITQGVPNGYMALGYLLFLQEQIKGIIITQ